MLKRIAVRDARSMKREYPATVNARKTQTGAKCSSRDFAVIGQIFIGGFQMDLTLKQPGYLKSFNSFLACLIHFNSIPIARR